MKGKVFFLEHAYESEGGGNVKSLGVFSSFQKAKEAITFFIHKPGFRDYPEDFEIIEYELDKIQDWKEGFVLTFTAFIEQDGLDYTRILLVKVKENIYEVVDEYIDHEIYKKGVLVKCKYKEIEGVEELLIEGLYK